MFKIVRKLQTFLVSAAAVARNNIYRVWPHRNSSIDLLNVTKFEQVGVEQISLRPNELVANGTLHNHTNHVPVQAIAGI